MSMNLFRADECLGDVRKFNKPQNASILYFLCVPLRISHEFATVIRSMINAKSLYKDRCIVGTCERMYTTDCKITSNSVYREARQCCLVT